MKNKKVMYLIFGFVFLSVVAACLVTINNTKLNYNSIRSTLINTYGDTNVEVSDTSNSVLSFNVMLDHNDFIVDDYVTLRSIYTKLATKKSNESEIYSITFNYYTPDNLSILSATVLLDELINTNWNSIRDTKELFKKANMYVYEH